MKCHGFPCFVVFKIISSLLCVFDRNEKESHRFNVLVCQDTRKKRKHRVVNESQMPSTAVCGRDSRDRLLQAIYPLLVVKSTSQLLPVYSQVLSCPSHSMNIGNHVWMTTFATLLVDVEAISRRRGLF